jgi:hypothetical protein
MIKLTSTNSKVVILGLSDVNMQRLKEDQPIKFNLRDLGPEFPEYTVYIFNGRDEISMMKFIKEGIGAHTNWGPQSN